MVQQSSSSVPLKRGHTIYSNAVPLNRSQQFSKTCSPSKKEANTQHSPLKKGQQSRHTVPLKRGQQSSSTVPLKRGQQCS